MLKKLAGLALASLTIGACMLTQLPQPTATLPVATQPSPIPPTQPLPSEIAPTEIVSTEAAPTETPPAPTVAASTNIRVIVHGSDGSLSVVDTGVPLDPAAMPVAGGLLPQGGIAAGTGYVLDFSQAPRVVALPVEAAGTPEVLAFVDNPSYGLAVWPGDAGGGAPSLAWAKQLAFETNQSQLFVSSVDGAEIDPVVTADVPAERPYTLVAERWSADGSAVYFSREPFGIGGYILFAGASSLYRVSLADRQVTELIPFAESRGPMICLDAFSLDERLVADHCQAGVITVRDLETGQTTAIQAPAELTDAGFMGSARFSPDLSRVAFALGRGDPSNEQGWVAVSDGLSGGSVVIVTGQPGQSFAVAAWLDGDTLLLDSNDVNCDPDCVSQLWTVNTDGSGLTAVAEGIFATLVDGYHP
jgi:hypothetical protein